MYPEALTITLEQARLSFAQWWADFQSDPSKFTTVPDLEGKDSSEIFFGYATRFGAA
jgi:hypothetical protein